MKAESVKAESDKYINKLETAYNKLKPSIEAYKKEMTQLSLNLKEATAQKSS